MSARLRISDAAVVRDLDGESVILNTQTGIYFGLDRIGTRVWQLIDEFGDVESIVRVMQDEYDADPSVLKADVESLVLALVAKQLVVQGGGDA